MNSANQQPAASPSQTGDAAMKLRQGSIVPQNVVERLNLAKFKVDDSAPVLVVISHDCDLVRSPEIEPKIELIAGHSKAELKDGYTNGQSPRTLHLHYEENGAKKVLELNALDKIEVDKGALLNIEPDPDAVLEKNGVIILQGWLSARYKRAAFPDELIRRMQPIRKKLSSVDSAKIVGIWMDYDPEDNNLPANVPYELSIKIVYSTLHFDAKTMAEEKAKSLRARFEKNFFAQGAWHSIDLRVCEAVADTVFSARDLLTYKQWHLEHLSLREDPPDEYL